MDYAVDLLYFPIEGIQVLIEHHDMMITSDCYDYFMYYVNRAGNLVHIPVPPPRSD